MDDESETSATASVTGMHIVRFLIVPEKCNRLFQAPFRPPKPPPPEVTIIAGSLTKDTYTMLNSQLYTDLVLVVGSVRFQVHRFMMATGSATFHRLLTLDLSDMGARSSSESSMVSSTFGDNSAADFNEDTEYLIRTDPTIKPSSR